MGRWLFRWQGKKVSTKSHREAVSSLTLASIYLAFQKARVFRSKSLCHEIERILDSDHRGLIGDYSKVAF